MGRTELRNVAQGALRKTHAGGASFSGICQPSQIMTPSLKIKQRPKKGVTIVKPIVFGNISQYFGKKRESDGHTHYWTVYVKPADEHEMIEKFGIEFLRVFNFPAHRLVAGDAFHCHGTSDIKDMSAYVKKVHFKLHESYANPQRVCTKPPYEVSETGWGEFEIIIKIYFVDHTERPVTLYHLLKLFQTTDPLFQQQQMPGQRKHLVSELYDEIIFQDPTQLMYRHLNLKRPQIPPLKPELDWKEKEAATLAKIESARKRVSDEISQVNERLKKQKHGIQTLKEEIQRLENKNKSTASSITT